MDHKIINIGQHQDSALRTTVPRKITIDDPDIEIFLKDNLPPAFELSVKAREDVSNLLKARKAISLGAYGQAADLYEAFLRSRPGTELADPGLTLLFEAHYSLGLVHLFANDLPAARGHLEEALNENRDQWQDIALKLLLGRAYTLSKKPAQATEILVSIADDIGIATDMDDAGEPVFTYLGTHGLSADLILDLARIRSSADLAFPNLRAFIGKFLANLIELDLKKKDIAADIDLLAYYYTVNKAAALAKVAAELCPRPKDHLAALNIAGALSLNNENAAALAVLEPFHDQLIADEETLLIYAEYLLNVKERNGAGIRLLTDLLAKDPGCGKAHYLLGRAYFFRIINGAIGFGQRTPFHGKIAALVHNLIISNERPRIVEHFKKALATEDLTAEERISAQGYLDIFKDQL